MESGVRRDWAQKGMAGIERQWRGRLSVVTRMEMRWEGGENGVLPARSLGDATN